VDAVPVFSARCTAALRPGAGDSYLVTILAVADPAPPVFAGSETAEDIHREIERLLAGLEGITAQEALDQVYRRLTLYLCAPCYRAWIEDPTGGSPRGG
jgi:hypothetical protein